jgi:hypothetical protein
LNIKLAEENLERLSRVVTRDITSYTLPDDVEDIVKILVGILE